MSHAVIHYRTLHCELQLHQFPDGVSEYLNLLLTTQESQGDRQWETGMPKAQGQSHQSNGATWLQTQADRMQD